MGAVHRWIVAAVCLTVSAVHSEIAGARPPKGLEVVPVAVSKVFVNVGCGATPGPYGPPCGEPPHAALELTFMGRRCHSEDFELRVRQREREQLVTVYRRSESPCSIGGQNWRKPFSSVMISSYDIVPGKPLRLLNPLPMFVAPRP